MTSAEYEIAESAADYMYHHEEEGGAEQEDCINAARDIYRYLTGEELDVEAVFGLDLDSEQAKL